MRARSSLTLALLAGLALASPATAAGMKLAMVGDIFCIGRLSSDMAPVLAILTPEFAEAVAAAGGDPAKLPWQSEADYANTCDFVGASGTADSPEAFIAYGFRDPDKAGYADRLVFRLVDDRLRIDDIAYGKGGGTMREKLKR